MKLTSFRKYGDRRFSQPEGAIDREGDPCRQRLDTRSDRQTRRGGTDQQGTIFLKLLFIDF